MDLDFMCTPRSCDDVNLTGYDLLDKLSRRRQYVRSHVKEKTCFMGLDPVQSFCDSDTEALKISGLGLMEKSNLETRRHQKMSWYDDPKSAYKHNAEYIKRLSSLRDNLFDQEQTNLAHALERLRARQTKEALAERQKLKHGSDFSDGNDKRFVTTLEKFQQTRPKRFPPELRPLEGKQLIEPQRSLTPEKTVHSVVHPRTADDSVIKNNLQRLAVPLAPTSSIPNIGRKSQKSVNQLVLESSPLQRKKTCLSADNTERNPFKHVHRGAQTRRLFKPRLDDLSLVPQAIKVEKLGDHDKLNMDKLKEYYCIYYLPSNTPTNPEELMSEDGDTTGSTASDQENSKNSNEIDDVFGNKYPSEHYRYKPGYFGASQRVPERKPMIHPVTGKALVTNHEEIRMHRLKKLHLSESINHEQTDQEQKTDIRDTSHNNNNNNNNNNKKQIIVDMPSIVFNTPTPDVGDLDLRSALLAKAYKQNELRHRELKNLMEDVKELNKRTDDLSDQITKTPRDVVN